MAKTRKLNKRLVAILTIGGMVILTIIIGLMIWATAKKDPMVYAERAEKFMAQKNYKEAVKAYQRAFRYSNKDPQWLVKMSDALYENNAIGKALGALQNAVIMDPTYVDAQYRLLSIYYKLYGRSSAPSAMRKLGEEAQKLIDMIPERRLEKEPELKKMLAVAYHCRGLGKYALRAEGPAYEKEAIKDIQKALELDYQSEFVESLALISMGKARQMAKLAASEKITIDAWKEYLSQMTHYIDQSKKLYLTLKDRAADESQSFISLGNFYQYQWGGLQAALASFCRLQIQNKQSQIKLLTDALDAVKKNRTLAPEAKRLKRMEISKKIGSLKRELPEWNREFSRIDAIKVACMQKASDYYAQAQKLAKSDDEKVKSLLTLARYKLRKNELKEAKSLIRKAIKIQPEGYTPYKLMVQVTQQETQGLKAEEKKIQDQ